VLGPLIFNVYVNDLCNAATRCTLVQYADDTTILIKSHKSAVDFSTKVEVVTNEIIQWFRANRLQVNVKKTKFAVFGRNRHLIRDVTVHSHKVAACECVTLLGLRIDTNLSYASHVNYVISRVKQTRVMLWRLAHLFDFHTRQYLVKALILPIINLYDFIYASASVACLHRLDVAYNDLMRAVLGIRRSVHFHIIDLHRLTKLDKLSDRRRQSLYKFMDGVVQEKLYSRLRMDCVRRITLHDTRFQGYIVPRFSTNIGQQRVVVRGLKLLNETDA
jgi:hypothetical protein